MKIEKKACPECNGSGVYQEYDEYDRYTVYTCIKCDGSGEINQPVAKSATSEEVAEAIVVVNEKIYRHREYIKLANKSSKAINLKPEYDKIDALELAITALQAYQPWIPVSERLPEEGAIVMVAYGEAIYFASIQYWGVHGKEVPVWRVGMGHRIEKDFSETHWKPYPETPKGEAR